MEKKITETTAKTEKTPRKQADKPKKKAAANTDFKRKYFDYYDDIKISDRQDW